MSNLVFEYANEHVKGLVGYSPGFQPKEEGWIKLNTNESPYPPSPSVGAAIIESVGDSLRLYPDPRSMALREAAAELHGLKTENVFFGNGSDDVLNLLVRAFSDRKHKAACPMPSYSLYPTLCAIQDSGVEEMSFDRSMRLPMEAIAESKARILFLTSPNAPTGVAFSNKSLAKVLETFDGLVVIDEAYADFAEENAVELLDGHDNAVITRSFSKSYALAGIRLGYALAHSSVIELLDRVKDSYNVTRLSQAAGLAAMRDQHYLGAVVKKTRYTRDYYLQEFEEMGWFAYPSQANFIFVEPKNASGQVGPEVAANLFEFFKENQILTRYFPGHALTASFLRISVGDDDQMLTVSESIRTWLTSA